MQGGTEILSDSDLNNYTSPGNYYCRQNAIVSTLSNAPFANAFTLKVEYGQGSSYPRQTARDYLNGKIATRAHSLGETNAWSNWVYFSNDATFLSYHNSTTASDLNEMRSIGAYWINPSTTAENHPSNTFGMLEVMGGMQRFTEYDNQRRIFVRFYANSQWTSWVSFDHS